MNCYALDLRVLLTIACATFLIPAAGSALAQGAPSADERVAALKQSLQENQARLRQYEWIETTIISLKGEEKSRKQQRCYYGADGKVQKVAVGSAPPAGAGAASGRSPRRTGQTGHHREQEGRHGGLHGASGKPDPPLRPAESSADPGGEGCGQGGASTRCRQAACACSLPTTCRLAIHWPSISTRPPTNCAGIDVATYLDTPEDPVTLSVRFATLDDGTSYVAQTTLDAKAKNIRVVVENSAIGRWQSERRKLPLATLGMS